MRLALASVASTSSTSTSRTTMVASPNKTAEKTQTKPAKKTAVPGRLARAMASASSLPQSDPVWIAREQRLGDLVDSVHNDTRELAEPLRVDKRCAQRLRAPTASSVAACADSGGRPAPGSAVDCW